MMIRHAYDPITQARHITTDHVTDSISTLLFRRRRHLTVAHCVFGMLGTRVYDLVTV
jgi:hypothetical protein